jgi:lysophospholipase L1-like esterase
MPPFLRVLILAAWAAAAADVDTSVPADCPNVLLRGSLENCRSVFATTKAGHVAFMGGSITEMNGYRPMVSRNLEKRFPGTRFSFTDAGISSTTSTTGAFRLEEQVLSQGPVDLLFLEFAVNDDQDGHHSRLECIRGMEGIVRHLRRHNPRADIVVTYFVNEGMLETFQSGKDPLSTSSHDEVLRRYELPGIELGREISQRIASGRLTWKQFGGVHPGPDGNRIAANMIERLLDRAWAGPAAAAATPHPTPPPLDAQSYDQGRFLSPQAARIGQGWVVGTPDWSALKGECRGRFTSETLISATEPGSTLTLPFSGRAIGFYLLAGPDAGTVLASVDGGAAKSLDLYHPYSGGLHYPYTRIVDADLAPGAHVLTLTLSGDRNPKSQGTAARILRFCENP